MCKIAWYVRRLLPLPCLLPLCGLLPVAAGQRVPMHPMVFTGQPASDLTGTYQGHAPAGDAAKRVFTLNLAADGTATLNTLYIGENNATERGRWKKTGNQVELTFEPMGPNQPPRPIIFRQHGHQLHPIHWDASEWGRSGPPVLHRKENQSMGDGDLRPANDPDRAFF